MGDWIKDTEVPAGYKSPMSSVSSYNPAWIAFINPYTFVLPDLAGTFEASIEQVNTNSYDGSILKCFTIVNVGMAILTR